MPYIVHHKALVKESNPKMTKNRVLKKNNKTFLNWFKDIIFDDHNAFKTLKKLVNGHKRNVITWQRYNINKYLFYTKSQDGKSIMQNSDISLRAESNTLLLYMMTIPM